MNLLGPFLSAELVLFAVTATGLHITPREGSIAGGTWITITLPGSTSHQLERSLATGSHLEVSLVNPGLPRLPCDVSPVYFDLSTIRCRTRPSPWEGLYYVEVLSEGRVINNLTGMEKDSSTFKFSAVQTPVVYQISPPSGVPGNLIELYGKTITGRYETLDFNVDYVDGPALLVAEGDGWTSLCSFVDKQAGHIYPVQVEDGLGTLQCRVEGNHIGSHNVSFSVFNKGRSAVHKDAWLISAKQDLFLYQTHSEISSVFPASGSLGGGTELTIVGDFFEEPVQVTVAGVHCKVQHLSPQKIICTTESVSKGRRLAAPQPGNRGLLFEVWDDASDLTETGPGYRWQFVPDASSPVRFLSGAKQSFSSRLRGFFVAPETNNYTFWLQADGQASLYLSLSQDPGCKARIASLPAGNSEWLDHWEKDWSEGWQPKSPKFELTAGSRYYLEAWHHGKAPSSGMRIGVQIHNTWLNPHVVNTYYLERHEIRARALQLPEVQMLTVSGTGWFSISWNNISSNMIPTNATAKQVQRAIEELLSIGCEIEPSSAKILFQNSFEKDTKDSVTTGLIVSGTEPFCGRFSVYRPGQLLKTSSSTLPRYDLTEYTHVCFAHKGYMSKILHISVSYTNVTLHSVKRNLTCQWSFNNRHLESWTFTCTNLWEGCVKHSMLLQDLPANSPVFVRQVDLPFPEEQKEISESFYLDELIITDSNVTVSQQNPKPPWLDGRIIEAVTVVGSSPTYSVSLLVAGCGASLPLLSLRGALLLDGSEEDEHLSVSTEDARVNLTVRRLQKSSPPIGGTFRIYLANAVISGIPVNISSNHLHRLLQGSTNNSTAPYFNSSDFTVSKDSNSCYERIWTLTWKTKTGDLPNVINVSDENLTGLNPTVTSRVVYDGGVFIGPIFGDMLATFNNNTQVVVVVNDVLANCSGSCSFQFSQERTPLVSEVEYLSDGGSQATIVIRGTSFAREKSALQVEVNNSTCHVITLNESKLVCQTERLPVGIYQVMLLVRPYGFALNSSTGEGIFLRVEPKLVAIEPPTASEIGGLRVALRGTSLEGINLVLFGSQPCPISENARNSTRIECQVPSRGMEDAVVPVTLNSGHLSTTVTNLFQYDPSLNPEVVSLSRNRSGIAGGQELQIGISSFAKYQGLDIKVQVGHMWGQIQAQTDHGVNVTLPALAPGWYNISVIINGVAVATSDRIEPLIQYASEIFSTEPCCGSLLGGTLLTISGMGFSQNPALVSVLLNEQACMITHLSEETIWCLTPPAANLSNEDSQDISASVNVLLSNRSLLHASFEKNTTVFNYQRTLTPLITALGAEVTGSSLVLSIQGINITESMAKIGDSECALEFKHGNDSTMLFQCSLPLTNLEPGTYPIRVIQRQLGYAHVAARLQSLTVTPQITSIFPKQGSICGGMVLIISGTALKSRRNLVQVSLEGNYSCEIQNSDNNVIRCFLLPGAHPFPYERLINGSWALNVTVTVNGIGSVCLGDCTFHLHEQWTPFVDLVTWENSGTLTYLMIKGQQLAWPSESPVVHVNNQAVCKVTFWNETNIKCQMDCIAPGKYNISVSSGRSGQACFRRATEVLTVMPQVHQFYPQNFSTNGGGLLTLAGSAMKGKSVTSVLVDRHPCLILNVTCTAIQCLVPPGNGTSALRLRVDGIDYYLGRITYSEEFTPAFLSLVPDGLLLMMTISRVVGTDSIRIFVGDFACSGITITQSMLQCSAPPLPAGEYHVLGLDVLRGWASSNLTFTSRLSVTSVHHNWGGLNGEEFHLRGTGFSPGQTVVTICGTPCEILDNMTTTDLTCLAPRLNASLAILCGLTHSTADCQEAAATFIQCDVQVTVASYHQKQPVFYLYVCDHRGPEQHRGDVNVSHWRFAGLFVSPKVERDEVLIYNSSCNITMETEAEMECEGANQPITAKITEIWKNWGQNTQVPLQFCGRWAEERSWPAGHQPRDGDSVTIEGGRTLLLGTTTSILNLLHLKGGKLVFTGPGPVELHAHYILITDGGELHVGSSKAPFHHKAHIYLYGSLHSSPVFPYGIKFMAVRNGTLSMHGWMPKVAVTHLKSPARAKDTRLVLQEPVDWRAGDEILVGGTGLGDAPQQEERAVIESVNSTELYLTSPLRYFHSVGEEGVNGQVVPLSAVVALISRRVVVQGNVTRERMSHLRQCANAGVSGDGSRCLYERSERKLGSQDLGAVVVVEALQGEDSHLWVEGVQFWHMGQAFRHHRSALTIMGNTQMADSYIRGSCILDSFGQGLRLTGISNLTVDNNIFFNISGHGILLGEGLEKGNRVSNNIVIGLSGSDGLSSIEALSPAGIYIRAPANHIEGNMVCAAGYGYLFHLDPEGPSWIPLLSFSENVAHSCTRTGLLVYPEYLPESLGSPVQMHSFMAWNNQGGAQIFSSSNLELQSFQIFACKDFGIDIIESLGNTSVTNSFLIGHFGQKDRTCMSAGLKTPKRYQLFVSNTTFGNFDVSTCAAIGTCSGCYQGQGGFTVSTERLTFINAPYQVSFPFPHSAVLADLDGSVTGHEGSYLLPSTAIVETSCAASANLSQASKGSVCKRDLVIHRMSIHLKEAPDMPYNLTVADSRNKTITVNYVPDTLSNLYGWVVLLLDKETYALTFDNPLVNKQLQYSATFSNFMMGNYLLVEHKNLSAYTEVVVSCGIRTGQPLQSLPSYGHHQSCDWYLNTRLRKLTYLVTGADLIQVTLKERVPLPTPVPSDAVLKWSHPETWNDVGKGWGGSNSSIPGAGEDVIILPNRTILVDTALPPLRGLYILGTLEFPSNSSNVLSAACIVLVGGTLRVGSFQHPLEGSLKLLILLRASEGIYCDRLEGINIHAGSIGVYGKLQIHSAYPRRSWTHLGTNIAPGNERIFLEDEVDWNRGGHIVISSSSYEAHQAEVVTLKEINGRSIRIHERILHRHIGCSHDTEDGRQIPLAAEVGLLTRNVQIKSDVACTGRMLVGRFRDSRGTEFEGVLQLLNIEFLNFGPPQLSAIEFRNVTQGSLMVSSSIHGSCGSGIKAVTSNGIWLHENVVFNTFGPGIDLEGQNHSLIRNLVILSRQPEGLLNWVAGIKVNLVIDVSLHGNVVAGSDRIAFHIRGQECLSDGDYCSENVAHSSLHGVHLFRDDGFQTCTKITGFLSYKNYDYGIMFHLGSSVIVDSVVLVDNNVGLLPVVYCLCAEQCRRGKRFIELRNSVIVATSSTFDCIKDRIKPLSADLTSGDRPPSYPRRGRVGILWPTFTTTFSQRPDNPWHKIGHCLKVLGHMKIKEVTFTGFIKSCHSEDRDVCIMSSTDQLDVMPLITAERSRMLQVNEKDKFYFYQPPESVQTSEDITVPEKRCTNSRKALFKDLDGGILDLEPPASVFPKSEFESTQFYLQAGIYREDNKCTFNPSVQGYFCKQTAHTLVILENLDPSRVNQRLSPVLAMTDSFMDTFSDVTSNAGCYPAEHPPAFSAVLPSNKLTTVCFPDLPPATFRLYLLSGQNSTRLPLAIFYNEPLSLRVFIQGKYVSPTLSSFSLDEGLGTNYFNFENNLLYVLLHGEEPVEIVTGLSLHIAFSLPETTGEESETRIIYRLADFLQIGHDQIRIVYRVLGGENILKVISSNVRKRRYHCPKMTFCTASYTRAGSQGVRRRSIRSRTLQPSAIAVPSKVLVIELGDPPGHGRSEFNRSLTIDSLKSWARTIIITHQTGDLQRGLDLPVDTLMVTQPSFLSPEGDNNRNGSRQNSGTCLYVRPYNISVRVQPSDGEMEKPLPVQPQIIFLDRKGKRVDKLGLPSEPWVVSAHLKGSSEAVLKGITAVEVIDGYASFTNLAVSRAGTNWNLLFTVTSPPGVEFTVLSQPFTIFPVLLQEKSSMILVILSSGVSTLVLGLFAFCCLKKSKSKKRRTEQGETRQRAEARTNAPQTRAQPRSAHHLQPRCNRGEKESGFSAKGDTEENGAVGDARGQLKEVNQQSVEASSDGKTNTVHDNDSYQEPCGGASPGASLAPQQLAVPPLSSWEDASQSSAAHNEKREKAKKVPKFQKDTTEDIAMEAADTWEK